MFIISAKLTKRTLILGGAILAVALAVFFSTKAVSKDSGPIPGETDQQRVAYLASLGWAASPTPSETLEFTLPSPLGDTYDRYNQLQKDQGFDLTAYAGRQVKRFTYPVSNHPDIHQGVQADLYVCDGAVIGGDILCTGPDSFVATLEYPK